MNPKQIVRILFFFLSTLLFSQKDSLQKYSTKDLFYKSIDSNNSLYIEYVLKNRKISLHDSVSYYAVYGNIEYYQGNYKKSFAINSHLLKLAQKENNVYEELTALLGMAYISFINNDTQKTNAYVVEIIKL